MTSPTGLGDRGLALWQSLSTGDVARDALVLEASRLADRLDELDNIIQGKGVLDLMQFRLDFPESDGEPFTVEVRFQNVLSEARQQQLAFNNILSKLGLKAVEASPETGQAQASSNSPDDMLAARRAEREAAGQ